MKIMTICAVLMAMLCFNSQAMAGSAQETVKGGNTVVMQSQKTAENAPVAVNESNTGTVTTDPAETPLDNKEGYNTSNRLAAEGPANYDDNTGLMNATPSDSQGDIED
ncbi:MAG: hypothetical protein NTZ95_06260 [Candidatus Omnitrophica bacterium]|nr:hypothetical protein [Candidatus Omnitrophota bacterium]